MLCVAILIEALVRRSGCKLSLPYYRSLGAGSAIPVQSCRDLEKLRDGFLEEKFAQINLSGGTSITCVNFIFGSGIIVDTITIVATR